MNKLFPDQKIIETKFFDVHQDWKVPIPGFFILAPKRKIRSIDELADDELVEYIYLVRKVRKAMRDVLKIENVYFFQNEDTGHNYHLWIFPRYDWMKEFRKGIDSVRSIMNYAVENMQDKKCLEDVILFVKKMRDHFST